MTLADFQCLLPIVVLVIVLVFLRSLLFKTKPVEPENQIQTLERVPKKTSELGQEPKPQRLKKVATKVTIDYQVTKRIETPQCPYCKKPLDSKPTRKQPCPHCNQLIAVVDDKLMTEEDAFIDDWLTHLWVFDLKKKHFEEARKELTQKFGQKASVNDTLWSILNKLIIKHAPGNDNEHLLEDIYRAMSRLVSSERKDPTRYLIQAEEIRMKNRFEKPLPPGKTISLGKDELEYVRWLRDEGRLDEADELLLKSEPYRALLTELRKNASVRAAIAKKEGNWQGVIEHLESYIEYANQWREWCIENGAKQEPPDHTATDQKLLAKAKEMVNQNNPKP